MTTFEYCKKSIWIAVLIPLLITGCMATGDVDDENDPVPSDVQYFVLKKYMSRSYEPGNATPNAMGETIYKFDDQGRLTGYLSDYSIGTGFDTQDSLLNIYNSSTSVWPESSRFWENVWLCVRPSVTSRWKRSVENLIRSRLWTRPPWRR